MGKRYLVAGVLTVEVLALLVAFGDEALVSLGIVTPPGDFASLMAGAELLPVITVLLVATAAVLVGRRHGKVAVCLVIGTVLWHVAVAVYLIGVSIAVDGLDPADPLLWQTLAVGAAAFALAAAVATVYRGNKAQRRLTARPE